jgi:Fic family protein
MAIEYFIKESNAIEGEDTPENLKQSLIAWHNLWAEKKLTGGSILKLHKILMLHAKRLRPNERGYWRTTDVRIGYDKIVGITPDGKGLIKQFVATGEGVEWRHVPDLMKAWVERANLQVNYPGSRIDEDTKQLHIQYEQIHPFADGNGRTGRMILNWQRLKAGLPLLIIHDEGKKEQYYAWFK